MDRLIAHFKRSVVDGSGEDFAIIICGGSHKIGVEYTHEFIVDKTDGFHQECLPLSIGKGLEKIVVVFLS